MIYYHTHAPEYMSGEMLDHYLQYGWYRIQQKMITTDVIIGEDASLMPVFWIRFDLLKYLQGKRSAKIMALNRHFTIEVKPFEINAAHENLFEDYKSGIDFQLMDSVKQYLLGDEDRNVYDTRMIEVRDSGRLIAVGIFDEGKSAIAGILNFYHPAYKKYSPGKFLMLLKMNYAKSRNHLYYYPGYICTRNPKFDYKLFPDKNSTEVFLRNRQQWLPYLSVNMNELENLLIHNSILEKLIINKSGEGAES